MNIDKETGQQFSALNEVKLSAEDKNDILQNLRKEMALSKPKRKRRLGVLSGAAAAIAAVAVVAAGISIEMHRQQSGLTPSSGDTTASNQAKGNSIQPKDHTQPTATTVTNGIKVETYQTVQAAGAVVAKLQGSFGQVYPSGPPVDLGTGIQANFSGGAGQYRYQWHEGNWTINLLGFGDSNIGGKMAKNVVSYLHTNMLPAPNNKGTIIINGTSNSSVWNTTMAWQEGNQVYQLEQSGNPVSALTVAVNSGNPVNPQSQFQQIFKNSGASHQMYLTPTIGFQVTNLGGGANNFVYQFSKTTDGGKTWTKTSTGHYSDVLGLSFVNTKTGYLLNNSPAYAVTPDLFVTHDGGVSWQEQKLPIPSPFANFYRASSYPIFFSPTVGFIPIYGENINQSSPTQQLLYVLVTLDGGASWTAYTNGQGGGLTWTVSGQTLTVTHGKQGITVNGLFAGDWTVSSGH
ncbi:WD40/YVTN/BNR-like repeat-containing protein [Alicyclobacillus ferrooxydans]|uniref:Sortilin N-terminal domain-containing protein n=1 Tax=Alicyclobacillus ferrooxydans TaxID=471514 RepID=A0A0P9CZ49_9BACL|nr:hypothetical protein [Alicyclobacillus ferrooxydans]KPV42288.1 hypothetical protein AN477_18460 [Alicyclobacillus ferrooxydans]